MQLYVDGQQKASIVYHDVMGSFNNRNKVIISWKKEFLKKGHGEAYVKMMPADILMPSSDMLSKTIREYKEVLRDEENKRYQQKLRDQTPVIRPFA